MSTQSVCLFALEIRCTVCSYGTSTAYFVTYATIRGTMNYAHIKAFFLVFFSYFLIYVFALTLNFIKKYTKGRFYGDSHEICNMSRM